MIRQTKYILQSLILLFCSLFSILWFSSCQQPRAKYVIGVSQCSADIWRTKQNSELRMGTYLQEGVELRFAAAYDSDERQVEQIDSLLASGIDLLIVAPNQVATISPAIDRAFDSGIPVIVFERKTSSQKFTAFVSADNYEMGHQMGDFIVNRLQGHGQIVEVMGLKGSSPAIERHNGFISALADHPDMKVVATLQGDWTEQTAYQIVKSWLSEHPDISVDLVFGMNDRSAIGARTAFSEKDSLHLPLFCGIDGLPGKDGGIRLVRDSILEASFIYPTYGDRLLKLAVDILDGRPYQKETLMMSALVTRDNANVLLMQTAEILRQEENLDQLHIRANTYLNEIGTQRVVIWLAGSVILFLLLTIVFFYLYHIGKMTLRRERVVNNLWNLKREDLPVESVESSTLPGESSTKGADSSQGDQSESGPSTATSLFITRYKEVVESRLSDSELTIEDLAADMNLSRVQLYRRVKSVTGSTPIELLRTARLSRAYQLLLTTDKSISEVAYQVGFTSPSYFTKCFKEEYGMLPGDVKNRT